MRCETYWLPEADLIRLGDTSTVNAGCVVQTHLFHDRILAMDTVPLGTGATLGPNSIVLPAASLGRHATVGLTSLVMRGESVPDKPRWLGTPIGLWIEPDTSYAPRRRSTMRPALFTPTPDGADPYVSGHGDLSFDVDSSEFTLNYTLAGNRLVGKAVIHCRIAVDPATDDARDADGVQRVEFDLRHRLKVTKRSVSGAGFRV